MDINDSHDIPGLVAHCHRCERDTATVFKFMPAGIGNACAQCGAFRKGRPYISKNDFNTLTRTRAEGEPDVRHKN